MFGFIRVFSATFKSNSMEDELTNTASSSLEVRRPATIPMNCSSGHNLLRRIFARMTEHGPRFRLTIRQRVPVLEHP